MADETPAAPVVEPVAAPAPAPAASAPAEASPAPVTEAAAPAAEPAEGEAPSDSDPAAPAASPEAEPAAPAEAAPAAEAPKAGEGAPDEAAPAAEAINYAEALKVPDGITMAPDQMTGFAEILGKNNISAEVGQQLMDFGAGFIKKAHDDMAQRQVDTFSETRKSWVAESRKMFGNQFNTTVEDAKFAISNLVPDQKARKQLWDVLSYTGAGDNPHVVGVLAKAGKILRERDGGPAKGTPQTNKPGTAADRRYGGKQPT